MIQFPRLGLVSIKWYFNNMSDCQMLVVSWQYKLVVLYQIIIFSYSSVLYPTRYQLVEFIFIDKPYLVIDRITDNPHFSKSRVLVCVRRFISCGTQNMICMMWFLCGMKRRHIGITFVGGGVVVGLWISLCGA